MTSTTTDNYVFAAILKKAAMEGVAALNIKKSREWFRNKALSYGNINRDSLFNNSIQTNNVIPGKMYMYVYDAKTKDKLPYWDAFPLIFCTNVDGVGHEGINLHYLPPVLRARLMDSLYSTMNNQKYDASTKLRISYSILKQASGMKYFRPCYKKYLKSQVKSKFIEVQPHEWDIALFLPLQNFQKSTAEQVWRDSSSFDASKFKATRRKSKWQNRKRF